jgi:hypothetical protein
VTEQQAQTPEQQLAAIYATRRGVQLGEALQLAQLLLKRQDRAERLRRYLEALQAGKDLLSSLPPQVGQAIAPLLLAQPSGDDTGVDVKGLTALAITLKSLLGDPSQEFQMQLLKTLLDRALQQQAPPPQDNLAALIAEKLDSLAAALSSSRPAPDIKEELARVKELAEMLGYTRRDEIAERIASLERKLEQLSSSAAQPASPAEALQQLLGQLDRAKEVLEALGYKVERQALTPAELQAELRRREEELRRKLEVELELERERVNAVKEIILAAIREIGAQFTQALAEAQKEALRQRILQKLQEGAHAGQGGVEGGGPAG